MTSAYDFAAYAPDGQLGLVVEAKTRPRADAHWAQGLRANLLEALPAAPRAMFMIATPDVLYLWRPGDAADALPTFETLGKPIFAPYLARAGIAPGKRLDPMVFEMIVQSWLADRTRGEGPTHPLFEEAGLDDVLRGGRVVTQAAA